MSSPPSQTVISLMVAVPDARAATEWYTRVLGATELWNLGSFVSRAIAAGADGTRDPVRDHRALWGTHRQGSFFDPFGHLWLVGDKSPLERQQD